MKKALSWILALCMVFSLVPMGATAAPAARTAQIDAQPALRTEPNALPELPAETNGAYSISATVVSGSSYGEIELSASSANAREEVYLLANPDDGYLVEFGGSYEYYYYELELYYAGLDVYVIVMPDGDVDLEISFVKATGSSHSVTVNDFAGGEYALSRTSAKQYESVLLGIVVYDGYEFNPSYDVTTTSGDIFYLMYEEGIYYFELIMGDVNAVINVNIQREPGHSIRVATTDLYFNTDLQYANSGTGGKAYVNVDEQYAGEEFILTCEPAENFKIYYISCTSASGAVTLYSNGTNQWRGVMPDEDVEIVVTFTPIPQPITILVTGGGTAVTDFAEAGLHAKVTLTCTPDAGYVQGPITSEPDMTSLSYCHWTDNGDGTYYFYMPNEPVTLNVTFEPIINPVTVSVEANGIGGTAFADVTEAMYGDTVTLTALPDAGYRVAQITGAPALTDNGDGTYTFTMPDKAVNISVLFLREDNPFLDVNETHFFYDPVLWAVEKGITNGIDATHFGPFLTTNRAAVVTMLWRYAGSPAPVGTENPFTDVPEDSFYTDAVLWAVENGITNGVSADQFGPDLPCNRAQVVTFLWRAWNQPESQITECPFTDVEAGSFYEEAVLWALENGITTGATDTTFNPNGDCLRAQFVTFLYRASAVEPAAKLHNVHWVINGFQDTPSDYGAVTLSHTTARAGDVVTATVVPAEGYQLDWAKCEFGSAVTQVSDTEFTFVMPDHEEIFHVNFSPVPVEPEPEPEPDPEPTDPEVPGDNIPPSDPEGTTYILNTDTLKFHYPDCWTVEQIAEENYHEYVGTRETLIEYGYDPCGHCDP